MTAYAYDNSPTGRGRINSVRYYNTLAEYEADTAGAAAVRKISYTYDALGRQVQVSDSAFGTPTTYAYDADGRVTKIDSPQGVLHYAYDNFGRKTATWTGAGDTLTEARSQATTLTEYGYDALNRLVRTTAVRRFGQNVDVDPAQAGVQPETTQTVFAKDGQIDYELASAAGGTLTKDYGYDSQGWLEKLHHFADANGDRDWDAGETLVSGFQYTHNKDRSRKSESGTDEAGRVTNKTWSYDGLGRVAREAFDGFDGSGSPLKYVDRFKHDFSSNRIEVAHDDQTAGGTPGSAGTDATTTANYDANDRLVSETEDVAGSTAEDRHTSYAYTGTDQTGKTVRQGLDATGTVVEETTFAYDVAGRMTGVSVSEGGVTTTVSYKYDHGGFRVERTEGGQTTIYHVDPANHTGYAQVLEEGVDDDGDRELDAAEVDKVYTLAAQVLTQATATQVLHLLTDAQGSTRAVLDIATGPTAAAIEQRYVYGAYGQDLGLAASPLTGLRYAGEMIDLFTGLSFNRARWYDPSTGQ